MTSTEPTSTPQITLADNTSGDQSAEVLEPPTLPFVPTASVDDAKPSSTRSSSTRIDNDDEEQLILPSSNDLAPPLPLVPTSQDVIITPQAPELTSTLTQVQQQSVQGPPTPSTQPQAILETVPQTPQTYLTFLLISGRRRTMSFEPESAIGRVKELAWNSWPTDWQDERPSTPSHLRVLYLGRMLQDDETLIGLKLPTHIPQPPTSPGTSSSGPIPTIMHLSIRPYAPPSESFNKKKKKRGTNGDFNGTNGGDEPEGGTNCCNCVIS